VFVPKTTQANYSIISASLPTTDTAEPTDASAMPITYNTRPNTSSPNTSVVAIAGYKGVSGIQNVESVPLTASIRVSLSGIPTSVMMKGQTMPTTAIVKGNIYVLSNSYPPTQISVTPFPTLPAGQTSAMFQFLPITIPQGAFLVTQIYGKTPFVSSQISGSLDITFTSTGVTPVVKGGGTRRASLYPIPKARKSSLHVKGNPVKPKSRRKRVARSNSKTKRNNR
jgi:hypothetical protein